MPNKTRNSAILNAPTSRLNDSNGFITKGQSEVVAALHKAILSSVFFSSIATDEKGIIQIFNLGAERMLGYAAADVVNKLTPADLSDAQELIARAQALSVELSTPIQPDFETLVFKASRGVEDIYELTYIRKDGSRLPAVVSVTALRGDAQDAITGYLLIGTENKMLKQAERERERERESLSRFPFENPNPIIRIARDGTLLYVNPQGKKQLNEWHLSEGKAAPLNLRKAVIESFDAAKVLQLNLNHGKQVFSFFVAPFVSSGYANLYATDITARKKTEEKVRQLNRDLEKRVKDRTAQLQTANQQLESELAKRELTEKVLRESEEQFRSLSEAAFEAIIIHDGGILLSTNNQFCEMFGYEPKELLGKQVMPLTIAPEAIEAVKKEIATDSARPYESTGLRKDGTRFPMEIRVREMEYKGRKVRIAAIMDITERKRAREALQQRTAQLEAANEELDAFAYSVSHDLRTPLRAMEGFSTALKTGYPEKLDEQGKHYLTRIQAASREMGQLIDDLLNLSRVTRSELKQQAIDLSGMAHTIAAGLKTQFPERDVFFDISDKMIINGDANLFKIALENLINNAWKFTSTRAQALIKFGMEEQEGRHVYFVRDNGVGFDMAYTDKLFIPFQRLHAKQEFPGTGIGLVTVKRIITRHGGRIWAEAGVDLGAAFYFTIGE